MFDERHPDICFFDVHMPGLSGVDAANHIGRRAHLMFITAYDHYAVQAFAHGALDYLLKPVEEARLAATVSRLKACWRNSSKFESQAGVSAATERLPRPSGRAGPTTALKCGGGQRFRVYF